MRAVLLWLRLDLRRRRRSLAVLALLIAFATGTVLAATAGARRGDSAVERMATRTLALDLAVLPNEPGFDWGAVRAMPEVAAVSEFAVSTFALEELADPDGGDPLSTSPVGFASVGDDVGRTVEAPVVLEGRMFDPDRHELVVTPGFVEATGYGVGDRLTAALASPEQVDAAVAGEPPATVEDLAGPRYEVQIVGVVRSLWYTDTPDGSHGVIPSPQFFEDAPASFLGASGSAYVNALVRLHDGAAGVPAFQEALAERTGRTDIDVFDGARLRADLQRGMSFEADNLYAFALAALLAALVLVGQSVARYTAAGMTDLRMLAAVGMPPSLALRAAVAGPALAAVTGSTLGVVLALGASRWFPVGSAALVEPEPGLSADWPVLAGGWAAVPLLVVGGASAAALVAGRAARSETVPRASAVATAAARLGWPVPVVVGARFALEPGRGRSAVPVRPALVGSVVGVLGVVAAFTFAAGVSEAAGNPARFGQTYSAMAFLGLNGQHFVDPDAVLGVLRDEPAVTALTDAPSAVAQIGPARTALFGYSGVEDRPVEMVLSEGRPPETVDEVVLGPDVANPQDLRVGDTVEVAGTTTTRELTLVGIGFTPEGPHNGYADAGWVTRGGYDALFDGFKFHFVMAELDPSADADAVLARLNRAAGDAGLGEVFSPPIPPAQVADLRQVTGLPLFLAAFLALLAVGAVGHALATAVRRRRHDIAVLRALGMTPRQARWVVVVQASVLAVVGLAVGVPLGLALGRVLWQVVADYTPLQYAPPVALVALALIGPTALLVANLLAAWPGRTAAGLRIGAVLRAE